MRARTFITVFFLLMFATVLLIASNPGKREAQNSEYRDNDKEHNDKQLQVADGGGLVWDAVFGQLLSAAQ